MSVLSTYIKHNLHKLRAVKDQYVILSMAHTSSPPVTPEVKQGVICVSMHALSCLARLLSAPSSAPAEDTLMGTSWPGSSLGFFSGHLTYSSDQIKKYKFLLTLHSDTVSEITAADNVSHDLFPQLYKVSKGRLNF